MAYLRMVSELLDRFMTFFCGYIDTADTDTADNKAALLSEIQMLKKAGKHPNNVNLVGACTQGGKLTIKLELSLRF